MSPSPFSRTYSVSIATSFPDFEYPKSFQRIQALLDSEELVKSLLSDLNQRVEKRLNEQGQEVSTCSFAMYDILREAETDNGFNRNEVKYLMGVLQADDFRQMVEDKCAFLDPFVTARHGAETHRIQWWMIIRDMANNPQAYEKGVSAGTLFAAALGGSAYHNPEDNVWYHCLDALQGKCTTGRAPESLKAYFMENYPFIADAEIGQMKWETTVKMPFARWQSLGVAGRNTPKNWEVKQLGGR